MNNKVQKEDLADYRYLYDTFIEEEEDEIEGNDLEIDALKVTSMINYNYIRNLNVTISQKDESTFLLDKDDLNELDSEIIDEEWGEKTEGKRRKAEPPKNPLTEREKEITAEENMALVHYVIKKLYNTQLDYEELFSIAIIGYAKALNCYDKSKNVKFSTYAINCIRNEIFYVLRKEKKHFSNSISLETVLSTDKNGNSLTLEDTLSEHEMNVKSLEDIILEGENREMLLRALEYLKEDEKFILTYRFGLDRGIVYTQKQIADKVNMSQANVSKIQKSSLNKLKLILKKEMKNY